MMLQRSLLGAAVRAGVNMQASRLHGPSSSRPIHGLSQIPRNANICSGMKLGLGGATENATLPYSRYFSSFIQYGKQPEAADGVDRAGTASGSMDYIQGLLQDRRIDMNDLPRPLHQPLVESNADVVHIKLMRNNAFVTLTDSKGNKKIGTSAGKLAGKGGKLTRYYGDAAAEEIGRKVRQMRTKSVVVKVNGLTFFRKKKDAILSFKDGYSNSQPNVNPVIYIEDTTRKPHNGCRLPKRRRI
ncbi:probable ribosomal protein S11, mitochondrial isoform X2 [Andrographis paniculata]|uniref:probable ribosomal protein S11, mitochondrial isoform X2 n=1 Tax=Andrographis paniculata TaxID=175694 RepID=UPI0021E7A41E|nr:probable ribosomal protein S11, mitochondrial isoform X2 [Andrographis paniculata]